MGSALCAAWRVRRCGFANRIPFPCGSQSINRTEGEKSVPARIAAICRYVQRPENPPKFTFFDPLFGNSLELEISASRTTWMPKKRNSRRASVKSALAFHASPRSQRRYRHQPVGNSAPVRAQAIFMSARWTNHLLSAAFRAAGYITPSSTSTIHPH